MKNTKKVYYSYLREFIKETMEAEVLFNFEGEETVITDEEILAMIEKELAALAKKSASRGPAKPSASVKANAENKVKILDAMEIGVKYDVDGLMGLKVCEGLKRSQVVALVSALKRDGKVERTMEKRKVYFERVAA